MPRPIPHTAEKLLRLFNYDKDTGKLYNRFYISPTALGGSEAGTVTKEGYRKIKIGGSTYQTHRIIWKMLTGEDAPYALWHINRLRNDNRIENLMLMLPDEGPAQGGPDAVTGIVWDEPKKQWLASILIGDTELFLGYFPGYRHALSARRIAETGLELALAQFTSPKS